ncbi:MAG: hypothetical protein IMW89_13020 [Ktedonobacteraceae bacterium]|nr:hypothetical protein [Ktedonobacteraceae bacterium]
MLYHTPTIEGVPALERIGDLTYAPETDLPFGKRIRIGLQDCLIYQSAIEQGYRTGIRAHLQFLADHQLSDPVVLDDQQFTILIEHFLPQNLSPVDQGLWRSYFILGWTCISLGILTEEEEE